jgi:hypothetical protein
VKKVSWKQDREISREEQHQLVWSKTTRRVAKEFGLSDQRNDDILSCLSKL